MSVRIGPAAALALCAGLHACSPGPPTCDAPPDPGGVPGPAGHALQFCGTGENGIDRVKVVVDDPDTDDAGPAVDVGATDFTLEWWMKATRRGNDRRRVACGENLNWINGNIVFDRDRFNQGRKYGVSIAGGSVAFGVSGDGERHRTICGTGDVADGAWHHVAVQRRRGDGRMSLYVDGRLEAEEIGPPGDVSYPDDGVPGAFCGGPCLDSDPYLVMGAEKHDAGPSWPAYSGWLDEVRISAALRYAADFTRPEAPFAVDSVTVALWHFDEGSGDRLVDSSPFGAHGVIHVGGPLRAPRWGVSDAPLR